MPARWRRDGALCGPVPGMHINKFHLGSPVLVFRLAPEQSSLLEKPLPGASRVPPAGTRGAGSVPPLPPQPKRVITSVSPVLKKAQMS